MYRVAWRLDVSLRLDVLLFMSCKLKLYLKFELDVTYKQRVYEVPWDQFRAEIIVPNNGATWGLSQQSVSSGRTPTVKPHEIIPDSTLHDFVLFV